MTQDKMTQDTPAPNDMPDEIYANDSGREKSKDGKVNCGSWSVFPNPVKGPYGTRAGKTKYARTKYIRADLTAPEAVGGENKPAVYYCENGKTLEGLEQGALAVLSNLMIKTNAQTAEFMIGNEKDGEFYFTCSRGKQPAAPAVDVEALIRDTALVAQNIDDGSGPHKQDVEWVIRHLAAQGMIKGRG